MKATKEILFRRNTVYEALIGRRTVYTLWVDSNEVSRLQPFITAAKKRNIPIQHVPKQRLGNLANDKGHQGVVLEAASYPYSEIDDILAHAAAREEKPFLLLLDLLHGPQNIGMLLRTAEASGVHGVILQDRRAPEITPAISIASAGAAEHLRIAQVTNLTQTMLRLKEQDIWFAGLDLSGDAKTPAEIDLNMALGLVIGHEGKGLRRRVHDSCDFILKLPMYGRVQSLNAAAAGSIALYLARAAREPRKS